MHRFILSVALATGWCSSAASAPCTKAIADGIVCASANEHAVAVMGADHLEAVTVVQNVQTGALVAFAASEPAKLDVGTVVLPLSLAKLWLAASWWDRHQPDAMFANVGGKPGDENPAHRPRVSIHDMLVASIDSAGREMAISLRRSTGTAAVLRDLRRYAFASGGFWRDLPSDLGGRLTPGVVGISLDAQTDDAVWADAFSVGEANLTTTPLHVSRFMQAVGNGGVELRPFARTVARADASVPNDGVRIMEAATALRLQAAMSDTVTRGTARSIAHALDGTGWQIGGRTGSGPGTLPAGVALDGWFAGLIIDPEGRARFTVATFVRHGGLGGGKAAQISADVALYLIRGAD